VTLVDALDGARRAVLDTMVLIYYFEDSDRYGDRADSVIGAASRGEFEAIVTPVTVGELLVKPLELGRPDIADQYRTALRHLPNLSEHPLTWDCGAAAGALRARYGLPMPDMLQVAAALTAGDCALVTNDRVLQRVAEIPVVLLDQLGT